MTKITNYNGIAHLVAEKAFSWIEEERYLAGAAGTLLTGVAGVVDATSCVGMAAIKCSKGILFALPGLSDSEDELYYAKRYLERAITFIGNVCQIPIALLDLNEAREIMHRLRHRKLQQTDSFVPLPSNEERGLPHVGDLYGTVAPTNHPRFAERITNSSVLYPLAMAVDGLIHLVFLVGRLVGAALSLVLKVMLGVQAAVRMVAREYIQAAELQDRLDARVAELQARLEMWIADPSSSGNKAEAKARILEAFRTRATHLNLSFYRLTTLPPEIGLLTQLQTLNLDENQLTTLPPAIGQLTQLRTLWFQNNQLTSLPPEIVQLTQLQEIYLTHNQLTSLPPEIGQLTQLRTLCLQNNQLASLSPEIVQLTQLQHLYLEENQLTTLPPEIVQLTQLEALYLSDNQLTTLPPAIGQLTQLRTLWLQNNQLTTLPPVIGLLTQLQDLDLGHNQLASLPPEIGQLTQLQPLDLTHNQLTTLPPEIGQLTQLEALYLAHNQLTSLPPEIGQLTQLQHLGLAHNPSLSNLPMTLGQIPGLTHFSIRGTLIRPEMRDAIVASTARLRRREATASLPEKLRLWQIASREDFDLSGVEQFNGNEQGTLNEWLTRLERARDFRGNAQAIMARAVCEMLVEATTNTAFKEVLLAQAEANNERCQDRASMALNELYTFLKLTQLDENAPLEEQFAILARAAKTVALRSAVAKQIATRQQQTGEIVHEAVEIYLFCETRLKSRLNLLSIISTMSYDRLGNVNWISLDALVEEVLRTYLDHLVTLSAFEKLAESGEYKRGHEAEYAAFHQELSDIDPNLREQEQRTRMEEIQRRREALDLQLKKEWARSCLRA